MADAVWLLRRRSSQTVLGVFSSTSRAMDYVDVIRKDWGHTDKSLWESGSLTESCDLKCGSWSLDFVVLDPTH